MWTSVVSVDNGYKIGEVSFDIDIGLSLIWKFFTVVNCGANLTNFDEFEDVDDRSDDSELQRDNFNEDFSFLMVVLCWCVCSYKIAKI